MPQLSKGEVAQYRELGYLIPAFRLTESRVAPLRQSLDRLIRDNPDVRPEKLVSAHVVIVERASAAIALTTPSRIAPAVRACVATASTASKSTARNAAWLPATLIVVPSAMYTSSTFGQAGNWPKSTTIEVNLGCCRSVAVRRTSATTEA